jgi:hypothetical protein
VSQSDGTDLDKNEVQLMIDSKPRAANHVARQRMTIDAVLPTTCTKCGGKGHLAFECYGNTAAYQLLPDDEPHASSMTHSAAPSIPQQTATTTSSSSSSSKRSQSTLPSDITTIEQARALLAQEAERKAKHKLRKEEKKRKRVDKDKHHHHSKDKHHDRERDNDKHDHKRRRS